MAWVFYGLDVLPATKPINVKASNGTQSTSLNWWPGFILSSSTTRLLLQGVLLLFKKHNMTEAEDSTVG